MVVTWKERYKDAHEAWQRDKYPNAIEVGGLIKTTFPDTTTANGLTKAIINFLTWKGFRATRINVQGRLIDGTEKASFGQVITKKKFIKSTTRRGTADISSTINGKSAMWEIKAGRDRPRDNQLKEQERERKAGGIYEFIYDMDSFLGHYDRIVSPELFR